MPLSEQWFRDTHPRIHQNDIRALPGAIKWLWHATTPGGRRLPPVLLTAKCLLEAPSWRGMQVAGMVDSGQLQVEGLVPSGMNNMYKMPVHIYCFGAPDDGPTARP